MHLVSFFFAELGINPNHIFQKVRGNGKTKKALHNWRCSPPLELPAPGRDGKMKASVLHLNAFLARHLEREPEPNCIFYAPDSSRDATDTATATATKEPPPVLSCPLCLAEQLLQLSFSLSLSRIIPALPFTHFPPEPLPFSNLCNAAGSGFSFGAATLGRARFSAAHSPTPF